MRRHSLYLYYSTSSFFPLVNPPVTWLGRFVLSLNLIFHMSPVPRYTNLRRICLKTSISVHRNDYFTSTSHSFSRSSVSSAFLKPRFFVLLIQKEVNSLTSSDVLFSQTFLTLESKPKQYESYEQSVVYNTRRSEKIK